MAEETITLQYKAELSDLRKSLQSIPNISETEARKMVSKLDKAWKRVASDQQKAQKEAQQAIKQGSSAVFGSIVNDVEDVTGALAALGPAGAVTVASVAGLAAVGVAAVGAVGAVVGLVEAGYDAAQRLEDVGATELISDQQVETLTQAHQALGAIGRAVDVVTVAMGAELAPAVERAALIVADLTLRALEAFDGFAQGHDVLHELAVDGVQGLIDALSLLLGGPLRAVVVGLIGLVEVGQQLGTLPPALEGAADAVLRLRDGLHGGWAEWVVGAVEAEVGTYRVRDSTVALASAVAELGRTQHQVREQENTDLREAQRQAELWYDWILEREAERVEAIQRAAEQQRQTIYDLASELTSVVQDVTSQMLAALDEYEARIRGQREFWAESSQAGITAVGDLAQAIADGAQDGSKAQKRAAMAAFRIQQGGELAAIGMATAGAIVKAIELFGPPPSPPGIAAIATAGTIGATQAAVVAATPPPSFHVGGQVGPSTPLQPDERYARVRPGSEIQTRQTAAQGATSITVVQQYQHRAFGAFIQDNLRMTSSPLRKELDKGSIPRGHYNRSGNG